MPPILTTDCKNHINSANRLALTNEFSALNLASGQWFTDDTKNNQYIAASTITHLQDAWSYFGKAVFAVLNNDTNTARHLAYYAELRAAMSLLASEGIGIFNGKHYYIDGSGNFQRITRITQNSHGQFKHTLGTHQMLWLTLEHWSTQSRARTLLEKTISIENIELSDWISKYNSNSWTHLTNEIFKNIGIDLEMMANDRSIRNNVSYAPSEIHNIHSIAPEENYKFIAEVWHLLEPSGTGSFFKIDKLFLKQALQLIDKQDNRKNKKKQRKARASMLNNTLGNTPLSHEYLRFLSNTDQNIIISKASKIYTDTSDAILDPENHLQVLGRTLLLLRIATGSVQLLLKDASISFADINFWSQKIIQQNGLCLNSDISTITPEELWSDISDIALDDVNEKLQNPPNDFNEMKKDLSYATLLMSEGERAMLWGLSY